MNSEEVKTKARNIKKSLLSESVVIMNSEEVKNKARNIKKSLLTETDE
jgi:ribosomal protein L29